MKHTIESARLLSYTPIGGETEYLESVSSTATMWTKDPTLAIHFLSEQLVPITTVLLRYPFLEPLKENATQSEQVQRKRIREWFLEYTRPLSGEI